MASEFEPERESIHASDVRVEKILRLHAWTAQFGIEIDAARAQPAGLQNRNHREGDFFDVGIKLIGIPTKEGVAGIGIDGAEHALRRGDFDFVLEGMASEGGVIRLDIKFKIFFEAVGAQESNSTGDIKIVLVFGRLFWFRLDEELALESDALGVIEREVQKSSQMILLTLEVGVEQRFVAFPAAPENVAFAAEFFGHLDRFLHLGGGISKDVRVGICRRAAHIAGVRK